MNREVWLPLVTLVGGYVGSLLTEWVRDRRAAERERRKAEGEERARRQQRDADFQRETLLSLQEAMQRLYAVSRSWTHEHIPKAQRAREQGREYKWPIHDRDARLSTPEEESASTEVATLRVRVKDDELRRKVENFTLTVTGVVIASDPGDALTRAANTAKAFMSCNERLGELLRDYY